MFVPGMDPAMMGQVHEDEYDEAYTPQAADTTIPVADTTSDGSQPERFRDVLPLGQSPRVQIDMDTSRESAPGHDADFEMYSDESDGEARPRLAPRRG